MLFSSIPLVSSYSLLPQSNKNSCINKYKLDIQSCKALKLWENGSKYEEEIPLNSNIDNMYGENTGVLSNVTGKDEGEYKCVGHNGRAICSGCLFVEGKYYSEYFTLHLRSTFDTL